MSQASLFLWLFLATAVAASQWTVTSYYVVIVTTSIYETYSTHDWARDIQTSTFPLKSGVIPSTSAELSKSTSTNTYRDIEIVEVYFDQKALDEDDVQLTETKTNDFSLRTIYMQPYVITGPASCATPYTDTTYVDVVIPTEVTDQITPTSYETNYNTPYTYVTAYLSEIVSMDQSVDGRYKRLFENKCLDFDNNRYNGDADNDSSGSSGGRYNSGDYDDDDGRFLGGLGDTGVCSLVTGCTTFRTWIIVVISIICGLFVLGFLESFFWFRRLMQGRSALRLGTVCWILITWLMLCATRTSKARPREDQERLRAEWKTISLGRRLKLWLKWGFRWTYPVQLLGEHPGVQGSTVVVENPEAPPVFVGDNKPQK